MTAAIQARERYRGPGKRVVEKPRAKENAPPAEVCLVASSSARELALLETAKREHRDASEAARRCLTVVTETTQVAGSILEALYQQGQQLERAAHGVEQIDEEVKHAGRIVRFMQRWCCFRGDWADIDKGLESRRPANVQQQRMAAVLVAHASSDHYASKRQLVGAAVSKHLQPLDAPAAAAAGAARGRGGRGGLIAAVPAAAVLARATTEAEVDVAVAGWMGAGLGAADRRELAAETVRQVAAFEQIEGALGALKELGLAMGQELEEQVPKIEGLQERTQNAGLALKGVGRGAAKLALSSTMDNAPTPTPALEPATPPLFGYDERLMLDAGKKEHKETTATARRALQVAEKTREVAHGTLVEIHRQGLQLESAELGMQEVGREVKEASALLRFMRRWCCLQCCDCCDPTVQQDRTRKRRVAAARADLQRQRQGAEQHYGAKQEGVERRARRDDAAYGENLEGAARQELFAQAGAIRAARRAGLATGIGQGLPARIGEAVGRELHATSQDMHGELSEQQPRVERLQGAAAAAHDQLGALSREAQRV
ncbi:Synaptosomal-associated 25 isoform A [Micractinium conductrix]|uniref:Synaptosomal-associated 25 isoform A n=1 Tax=Micractinium conductrix TaxID=554055 RepID=A0A2P6V3N2_9CHLO|nr:Synaptosomal-associated 25 isoform A [Micractinium conductrix]|eukprot:PSC68702.1 Synaptosomal-associated 25 isoform A [Micractinium conductrix]